MKRTFWFFLAVAYIDYSGVCTACRADTNSNLLTFNPGFEIYTSASSQVLGWDSVWARDPGTITGGIDTQIAHTGQNSYHLVSTGKDDWSFAYTQQVPVHLSDLVTVSGWVKCQDCDNGEISVVERDAAGNVINWAYGESKFDGTLDWTALRRSFVVDDNCATVQYRLIGVGKGSVWLDDASLTLDGNISKSESKLTQITLRSSTLNAVLDPADGGTLSVTLARTNPRLAWSQLSDHKIAVLRTKKLSETSARIAFIDRGSGDLFTSTISLDPNKPVVLVTLSGDISSEVDGQIAYPPAFSTTESESLVIPNNEGVLYPADDQTVEPYNMPLYGGHSGLCMAWYGQEDVSNGAGVMTIVQTPDDATLELDRNASDTHLVNDLVWEASKGKFGYDRELEYIFLTTGGYVAQAKQYRAYAEQIGLVKTLVQKRAANPNVDKLIGAADIWDWDSTTAVQEATGLKASGLDRVLWANEESPDVVDQLNALGYLTGRYDIYTDEYQPSAPKWDRKSDLWPTDLAVDKNGNYQQSWVDYQTGPDGKKVGYPADACCSIPGLARAKRDIPADLSTHQYSARFIDTITASEWRECYSPDHPTTRTQDKQAKMKLLDFVADTEHLVTGSETGIDCAVPYEDYFEGMESLARYRLPDSGYKIGVYQTPTPDFLKYQIGVGYRIPLFELVYHDCMVSTWYWGDASNQEPEVWRQRDLWNILYGTNPIYILDSTRWSNTKDRLIQSYKVVSKTDRAVGYAQMVDHKFLTADKTVQETLWSNGVAIIVNLGQTPFKTKAGPDIQAMDSRIETAKDARGE